MRALTIVLVVAAVVTATPRDRRQTPECQWFEPCAQAGATSIPGQGQNPGQSGRQAQKNTYQPCNNGISSCVPYYLCRDGDIVTDGAGLFDIRVGIADSLASRSSSECSQFLDVCCNNPDTTKPDTGVYQPHCGQRNINGVHAKITGFQDNQAQFGEFPWMAAVLRKETVVGNKVVHLYVCGGSLIHPSVVLTAAHCVATRDARDLRIRLGEWDTQRTYELFKHQDRDVNSVIVHPQYVATTLTNDYALVFLDTPADLTPNVDTICLEQSYDVNNCWATGWGTDKFGKEGEFQNVLKKIDLSLWTNKECQTALRETRLGKHFRLHDSFVCAGGIPGLDTCKGDGGSPLVCPRDDGYYTQSGIVAWGIGCGEAGVPGVYANIAYGTQWIIQTADAQLRNMNRYTENYWVNPAQ